MLSLARRLGALVLHDAQESGDTECVHTVWEALEEDPPRFPLATLSLLRADPMAVFYSNFFRIVCGERNLASSEYGYEETEEMNDEATIVHRMTAILQLMFPDGVPSSIQVRTPAAESSGKEGVSTSVDERLLLHLLSPLAFVPHMHRVLGHVAELHPTSLRQPDPTQHDRLPLHLILCCRGNPEEENLSKEGSSSLDDDEHEHDDDSVSEDSATVSLSMVQKFLDLCPESITAKDGLGCAPFCLAAWNDCDLTVVYHLVRQAPITMLDAQRHDVPSGG